MFPSNCDFIYINMDIDIDNFFGYKKLKKFFFLTYVYNRPIFATFDTFKSPTLATTPSRDRKIFALLRSRCSTLKLCRARRPSII